MASPQRIIRVAIVGDAGVGKTSLISTAATDTYDPRPPPQLPPTRLPPEFSPEHVPMLLTDTSSRAEDAAVTDRVMQQADVVVICFEARRASSLESVRSVWYPRLQQLNSEAPVVLACCKSDRLAEDATEELQMLRERVERCVYDLPSVEVCLNCSARSLRMVIDVFGFALKSVMFPMQPLYDRAERRLKPLAIKAFKRIFIMCDADKDSHLDNAELNEFQKMCFEMSLTDEELENIKHVVREHYPRGVDPERGLTLEGFLHLHVLFIERGRLESPWAVLRTFGYSDDLTISDKVLDQVNFNLPPDQVYELSDAAAQFLTDTFHWYDDDRDGQISHEQLTTMFSTAPHPLWLGDRWSRLLTSGTFGSILTLEAFLLKWRYAVLADPRGTLAALMYLGWGSPTGASPQALLSRCARHPRKHDKRHDAAQRTTLHCYVFGSRGSGKTSLLKALAGRQPHEQLSGWTGGALTAVGLVQSETSSNGSSGGNGAGTNGGSGSVPPGAASGERTLVLSEISEEVMGEWMSAAALAATSHTPDPYQGASLGSSVAVAVPGPGVSGLPDLSHCDVAAFVFDSSREESFRQAHDMLVAVSTAAGNTLPCMLIAAKDDLGMSQALESEVAAAVNDLALLPPLAISVESGELRSVFSRLAWVACHPASDGLVPVTPARKAYKKFRRQLYLGGAAVLGLASVGALTWWLYSTRCPDAPESSALTPATSSAPLEPPNSGSVDRPVGTHSSGTSGGTTSGTSAASSHSHRVSPASASGAEGAFSALQSRSGGGSVSVGSSGSAPASSAAGGAGGGEAVVGKRSWFSSVSEPRGSWAASHVSSLAPLLWFVNRAHRDWTDGNWGGGWLE